MEAHGKRKLKPIAICFGLTLPLAATAAAQDTRPSDLSKLRPQEVDPRPLTGAEAPGAPMTWAHALDTLRFHGYLNIAGLKQDDQGNWWAEAQKQFDGPRLSLELNRNGEVLERRAAQSSASRDTGINAVAARLLGHEGLGWSLFVISLAAHPLLWATLLTRIACFARAVLADFVSHERGPAFLTIIAANGVRSRGAQHRSRLAPRFRHR